VSDNIRYVVGLLEVSGHSPAHTFTHRPIVYRWVVAAQSALSGLASERVGDPHSPVRMAAFETGFNLVAVVVSAGAATVLWAGLRRRWPRPAPFYGVAGYAALALLTPMLGEPDWYAAAFSLAAVGAGLLGGRWTGGVLAGFLLALAALVKLVTLPVALAGLLVLWALDARRSWIAAAAAFAFGSLSLVAMMLWTPWEIGWLLDIRALQPSFWQGAASVRAARDYLVQLAMMWPAVVLVPAAFLGSAWKERWVVAGALVLAALPPILQGEYWLYHAISLSVLTSVLAVRTLLRSHGALVWPMLVWTAWTALLFVLPLPFALSAGHNRGSAILAHGRWAVALTLAASAILFLLQRRALRTGPRTAADPTPAGRAGTGVCLAVLASLLACQTPAALADTLDSRQVEAAEAARVREVIGTAPVAYLTPGWATYFLGNPTRCRYPSPLFLQRARADRLVAPADRAESLACLSWEGARWLVWRRDWLGRRNAAPDVTAAIDEYWKCEDAVVVGAYTLCARRS
jgi:hypothetical protein